MEDNLVTCVLENQLAIMYNLLATAEDKNDRAALTERITHTVEVLGKWRAPDVSGSNEFQREWEEQHCAPKADEPARKYSPSY
jgi:hypothetical protein